MNIRAKSQRDVGHLSGIATIQGPFKESLVCGEGCGVDSDTYRQSKNGDDREAGIAAQHAGRVAQILENGLREDHQIDLAHALPPQARIPKAAPGFTASFHPRHSLLDIQLLAHGKVEFEFFLQIFGHLFSSYECA